MHDICIRSAISASSGWGESSELLAELAETGDGQEGMSLCSRVLEEDVVAWKKSLEISELGNLVLRWTYY